MFRVQLVQDVSIDVDDDGEEPGDGAALVELATLLVELELPFVPFPTLQVRYGEVDAIVEEVIWNHKEGWFLCRAETIWTQTQEAAQGIVESLIEAGFCPLDSHHREDNVH